AGFTQSELAFLANGAHRTTVAKHEWGECYPGLEALLCYEILFGVCTNDLYEEFASEVRRELLERGELMLLRLKAKPATPIRDRKISALNAVVFQAGRDAS